MHSLVNELILNSSSQSRDYLLIHQHTHVSPHTMVAKLFTLPVFISLTFFKKIKNGLHSFYIKVRLFPFVLVEACFLTSFQPF